MERTDFALNYHLVSKLSAIIQTVKRTTCIREGTNRKNIINKINQEIDCVLHNCHFRIKIRTTCVGLEPVHAKKMYSPT